ncbi:MAG: hypothetical protein OEZ43_01935 [Gammaproteobacteria bacterium]|nr:hypothetical protein [Gammaproteobacteria bacterium]
MKAVQLFLMFVLVLVLGACNNTPPPEDAVADKLAKDFMQALQAQDYETLYSLVNDEFFSVKGRSEWDKYFQDVSGIMGKMESFRLKNKLNDMRFSGQFYMYEYVTKYENGLGKEMITIIHKINTGNEPLRIFSYKMDSSKLAKLHQTR